MDGPKAKLPVEFDQHQELKRWDCDLDWRRRMDPPYHGPGLPWRGQPIAMDCTKPASALAHSKAPSAPGGPSGEFFLGRARLPFGQRLQDLRRALGWTQRDAAAELGVSVRSVIRHERSQTRRPRLPLAWELHQLELAYGRDLAAHAARLAR